MEVVEEGLEPLIQETCLRQSMFFLSGGPVEAHEGYTCRPAELSHPDRHGCGRTDVPVQRGVANVCLAIRDQPLQQGIDWCPQQPMLIARELYASA